jgi:hypothetical protein
MRKQFFFMLLAFTLMFTLMLNSSCGDSSTTPQSDSGVSKASITVKTDENGNTVEQKQIGKRIDMDNQFGAIKHIYVISPYSGQVLFYSTIIGKVTSSGKRLTPKTVNGEAYGKDGSSNYINIGGKEYTTNEVIQDDGTYGESDPYIYWWDAKGIYHQHFMTGGQIVHVSSHPLAGVKSVVLNMKDDEN